MSEALKIPWGNDFYLRIPVVRKYKNDAGVVVTQNFPVGEASQLALFAVCGCGCKYALEAIVEDDSDNIVRAKVPGSRMMIGMYGIELCGLYQGRDIRSYLRKQFKLVPHTSANISMADTWNSAACYDVDEMVIPFAAPSYPLFDIDPDTMRLVQYGTVDNGVMELDENGHLIMVVV